MLFTSPTRRSRLPLWPGCGVLAAILAFQACSGGGKAGPSRLDSDAGADAAAPDAPDAAGLDSGSVTEPDAAGFDASTGTEPDAAGLDSGSDTQPDAGPADASMPDATTDADVECDDACCGLPDGTMFCEGTGFVTCDGEVGVYRTCGPGTVCKQQAPGTIFCDWE